MSGELNDDVLLLNSSNMNGQDLICKPLTEKGINSSGGKIILDNKQQKVEIEDSFQSSSTSLTLPLTSSNFFQTLKSVCKSGIITVYFLTTVKFVT